MPERVATSVYEPIADAIRAAYPEIQREELVFAAPPKKAMADVAVRLFLAARTLGMPPPKLAAEICEKVAFGPEVTEATAAGPYLNLRVNRSLLGREVIRRVREEQDRYGSARAGAGSKVLIEHTSINPNASPHVGRARNAMIGDSLVRLLRFQGYDCEVHYYVNDMGRQIALLSLVIEDPEHMTFEQMLDMYVDANERAKADSGFAARGYDLLAKMEQGDAETRERFFKITELCLQGQLMVLARLGVNYDQFVRESGFVKDPRLDELCTVLRERGALFEDEEERLVVDLRALDHEADEGRYFVLMRANGSSLYGYRDLAYAMDKADRDVDLNLIVLGEDHKMYLEQLARILGVVGKAPPEPVYYAYILLRDGKMSTRQGKVVLLSDFLDEATRLAGERVAAQLTDLNEAEQRRIASKVAVAAIRFAILRISPTKNVTFDWEQSLSFTGDTGPYVQYSCARIASILRKFGPLPEEMPAATLTYTHDAEWALLSRIISFEEAALTALDQRAVPTIAQFALDLAHDFTAFYHACPVVNAEDEATRLARAYLCQATYQTLKNALWLLGIEALERM